MDTNQTIVNETSAKIAAINDKHRQNMEGCTVTRGVLSLWETMPKRFFAKVRDFSDFNEDNDPYGEHDFGSVHWYGEKVYWKIDYYDRELKYGSEPLDTDCRRVMTLMLASEY